jgi:glycine/D-amino acid oxidase-like deaminating enzyme
MVRSVDSSRKLINLHALDRLYAFGGFDDHGRVGRRIRGSWENELEPHLEALEGSVFAPLWLDRPEKPKREAELVGDERCNLLIVGGGFTGLWAALQAREKSPELDIVLIEASEVGDGASGRNGGFISNSIAHGETNAEYHFPGDEERLRDLGNENLQQILDSLDRYDIDARFEETGNLCATVDPEQNEGMEEWVEQQQKAGQDFVWFDREAMQEEVHSPTYCGGLWDRRGRNGLVDPAALCWGLKRTVLSLGVRIYEDTPLTRMQPESNGMRVDCPKGKVRCEKLLMGTNAFRNPVAKARRTVIPVFDYAVATEPLSEAQRDSIGWKRRQGLSQNANMFHYYRQTQDHRITWGGGTSVCYYYGNRRDASVADPRDRFEKLSQDFFETFPQLAGLRFSHRWSGIIASTTRFCLTPGTAYDGRVSWSIGYTGLGVSASRFGARIGLELLGYEPTDLVEMQLVKRPSMAWPPEPLRWLGVTMTRNELARADRNGGRRGLWLKLLDRLHLGFAC